MCNHPDIILVTMMMAPNHPGPDIQACLVKVDSEFKLHVATSAQACLDGVLKT